MSTHSLFSPLPETSSSSLLSSLSSSTLLPQALTSSSFLLLPESPIPSSPAPSFTSSSSEFAVTALSETGEMPSSQHRVLPHKQAFIPMLYREDVRLETFSTWWSSSPSSHAKHQNIYKCQCRHSRRENNKCTCIERKRRRRSVNKELAALVGLYYTGYDELLCCYFCHCIVDNADTTFDCPQENDIVDVFEKHLLQSPECPLMRLCSNQTTRNVEICRGRLNKLLHQMDDVDGNSDRDDNYETSECESSLPNHQHRQFTDTPPDPSSTLSLSLSLPPVKPVTPVLYDRDLLADELIDDKTPYQNICLSCRQYVRKSLLKPCRHKPTCYFCSQFLNTCMICTGKITKLRIVVKK